MYVATRDGMGVPHCYNPSLIPTMNDCSLKNASINPNQSQKCPKGTAKNVCGWCAAACVDSFGPIISCYINPKVQNTNDA